MYLSSVILHTAAIISLAGLRRHQDCLSGIPRTPSATQMVAATPSPWKTAATEHSPEVSLLRSTKMSVNVVFINIDWKASRHNELCCMNAFIGPRRYGEDGLQPS